MESATLPDDMDSLKKIILSYQKENSNLTKKNSELAKEKEELIEKNFYLEEKLKLANLFRFARKSEKWTEEDEKQSRLFDEAEYRDNITADSEKNKVEDKIIVKSYSRKKKGRKKIAQDFPREEVVHDLEDDEKVCACGHEKEHIGDDVSEKLDVIPAQFRVIRNIYKKYACKKCEGTSEEGKPAVQTAERPKEMLPKSITTPGLLAYLFCGKFEYALPYYRQEKMFSKMGIALSRTDMCNWQIKTTGNLSDLQTVFEEEIRSGPLIHIDETTIRVLKENNESHDSKNYMWVYLGGIKDKPLVLYRYHKGRSGKIPYEFLKDYKGVILTDGYPGYNKLGGLEEIIHVGCWAHVRRKFIDAKKVAKGNSEAVVVLQLIRRLFAIERIGRKISPDELLELRQKISKPTTEKIKNWLDNMKSQVPPKITLGKAIHYALNEWEKLIRFLNMSNVRIDNNLVENAIRPFVIGRKNWMFSDTPKGAASSAFMYSLIESAKANGIDSYWYLRYLFEKYPYAQSKVEIKKLLPCYLDKGEFESYKANVG